MLYNVRHVWHWTLGIDHFGTTLHGLIKGIQSFAHDEWLRFSISAVTAFERIYEDSEEIRLVLWLPDPGHGAVARNEMRDLAHYCDRLFSGCSTCLANKPRNLGRT